MASTTPTVWAALGKANTTDAVGGADGQYRSRIIALKDGGFLVAWEDDTDSYAQSLGPNDIVGQRYNALGNKVGGEIHISAAYLDLHQQAVAIAASSDGGFFGAYQSEDAAGFNDGENIDVAVFDAAGSRTRDDDFRQGAGQVVTVDDKTPAIAGYAGGGYVVTSEMTSAGITSIIAFVVDAAGSNSLPLTIFNNGENVFAPQVAILAGAGSANGRFATVYENASTGMVQFTIRERPNVPNAFLDQDDIGAGTAPDIAALAGGGFAVAWVDPTGDGAGNPGIRGMVIANDGTKGSPFSVNTTTAGAQSDPVMAPLSDGGFAVIWEDGASRVRGQAFTSAGTKIGTEFTFTGPVGTTVDDPDIALLGDGRLAVSFTVVSGTNEDVHVTVWDPRLGTVVGTAGADVLTSHARGGTVLGLGGADTLLGRNGADRLEGGAGADVLRGYLGNDTYVLGGEATGVDKVVDTGGVDTIVSTIGRSLLSYAAIENLILTGFGNVTGNSLANVITGSNAANVLDGGLGNDTLKGLAGNDVLIGGAGKDIMAGGIGNDVFRFAAAAHSAPGAAADVIVDFDDANDDRIDFSSVFGPVMTYRHDAAFTGAGQVRINDIAGPDVVVEVNIGGSLAADMQIRLTNTTLASMTASDFIL